MRRSMTVGAATATLCATLLLAALPAQAHQAGCNADGASHPASNSTAVLCTYLSAGAHALAGCAGTPGSYVGGAIPAGAPITAPVIFAVCFPPVTYAIPPGQHACVAVDNNHAALAGGPTAPVGSVTCGEI